MTGPDLSNRLAALAEDAGDAFRRGRARTVEAAAAYLDCGRLLAEAKAEAGHGQWLPFLARAGIAPRTAQRLMSLARSGIAPEDLAERGVKAAAADLARPRRNTPPEALSLPVRSPDPKPDPAERSRQRRNERRAALRCVDCGAPAGDKARCPACREAVARRDRRRRAMARTGEALAPRLAEAAKGGDGLALSPAEVRELAPDDP